MLQPSTSSAKLQESGLLMLLHGNMGIWLSNDVARETHARAPVSSCDTWILHLETAMGL